MTTIYPISSNVAANGLVELLTKYGFDKSRILGIFAQVIQEQLSKLPEALSYDNIMGENSHTADVIYAGLKTATENYRLIRNTINAKAN